MARCSTTSSATVGSAACTRSRRRGHVEFAKRIGFAAVAIPLVVWAVWAGGAALAVMLAAASAIAAWEFYRMAIGTGSEPLWGHGVVFAALIPLFVHARFEGWWAPSIDIVMLLVLEILAVALWVRGS